MDNAIIVCLYAEQQLNCVTVLIVCLVCRSCLSLVSLLCVALDCLSSGSIVESDYGSRVKLYSDPHSCGQKKLDFSNRFDINFTFLFLKQKNRKGTATN